MNNRQDIISDSIIFLRFPLILAVVFIHTSIANQPNVGGLIFVMSGQFIEYDIVDYVIRRCFAEIAVPLFFVISGYLFFFNSTFTFECYCSKLRRRIRTLLVPYLIWNTLFFIYTWIIQMVFPSFVSPERVPIWEYSLCDFVDSYWHYDGVFRGGGPIYGPLWFIRDLIIACVLSPGIYWLVKSRRRLWVIVLEILYILGIGLLIPGVSVTCLLFFSIGAWASVNKTDIFEFYNRHTISLFISSVILLLADILVWYKYGGSVFLHRFFIIVGAYTVPGCVLQLLKKKVINKVTCVLAESSFFVYVFHRFIITFFNKYWVLIMPVNGISSIIALIMIPIITSFICIGVYLILKTYLPKVLYILVGGRS